jgi:hypothetical protein
MNATRLMAGAALLAGSIAFAPVTPAAATAVPKVSGTYALLSWSLCQAKFTTKSRDYKLPNNAPGPAVQEIDPGGLGEILVETGYVTFAPTSAGATSGTFSGSTTVITGSALAINASGSPLKTKTESFSGPYSATDTSFTLNTDVFVLSYGDVAGGLAKTINLVRKESASCLSALSLTRQP